MYERSRSVSAGRRRIPALPPMTCGLRRGVELWRERKILLFDGLFKITLAEAEAKVVGFVSSRSAVGHSRVRLCDGGVFQPEAGAGDLRFGGVPLYSRQRPSRPRHDRNVSPAVSQGDRGAVCAGAGTGARDGDAEDGHGWLDGTKIHANASRHSALSYEHAGKIAEQLKAEVAELLARAEAADQVDVPDGLSIPDELARREKRMAKLAEARAKIEARAKERYEQEAAEHKAKLAAREAKAAAAGKTPGGRPPQPPQEGARPSDQINLTDEDSRIMPVAGGGFEQCYNAQAVVAADSLLVVAAQVVQAPNDKQQIEPMLERLEALPEALGKPETMLADTGCFSEANVELCAAAQIEPMIALGRQPHYPSLAERFAKAAPAPQNPTPLEAMRHLCRHPQVGGFMPCASRSPNPCSVGQERAV